MINSSSDNVKKLNSINRRMFITGSLKFFIMIGIVSRLFKNRVMGDDSQDYKTLYVNDMSGYSETLNKCYLTSTNDLSTDDLENLISHLKNMTNFLSKKQIIIFTF